MDIRELDSTTLMWLAAALAVLFLLLGLKLSQWWASWQSRGRNRVARAGEIDAERMLARAGFRVVARQQPARWTMSIDGDEVEVAVRADLIVERKGKRYVAEVKTGGRAPDPCLPSTDRKSVV